MRFRIPTSVLTLVPLLVAGWAQGADPPKNFSPQQLDFFERQVRPLLAANCLSCHGPQKQEGGLRLDTREAVVKGGDSGPAAIAGNAKESLLVQAILREADLQMPPSAPLRPEVVAVLTRWVELGLPWPEGVPVKAGDAWKVHWAFQLVAKRAVPIVPGGEGPLDNFVIAKLQDSKLKVSPQAEKRTLIRRAYFDLLGFPPAPIYIVHQHQRCLAAAKQLFRLKRGQSSSLHQEIGKGLTVFRSGSGRQGSPEGFDLVGRRKPCGNYRLGELVGWK